MKHRKMYRGTMREDYNAKRIKSIDFCLRKYEKFYPEMRLEKVFNDILGFRMLITCKDVLQVEVK